MIVPSGAMAMPLAPDGGAPESAVCQGKVMPPSVDVATQSRGTVLPSELIQVTATKFPAPAATHSRSPHGTAKTAGLRTVQVRPASMEADRVTDARVKSTK